MTLDLILILALHTCLEQLRNRSFQVALLFSGLLIYMSLLLGVLAADQEVRVLLDFGLSAIELMALLMAVYGAATAVLREMETKTIYLILTRPVSRAVYLLGRYFGLLISAGGAILAMAAVHVALLAYKGWTWQWGYPLALLEIFLKIAVAAAMTSFLALATTSVLSALTMMGIAWTLGHFIPEMSFLARKAANGLVAAPLLAAKYLAPNLGLLNFRDRLGIPPAVMPHEPVFGAMAYAILYSSVCLTLAYAWLRKKEF